MTSDLLFEIGTEEIPARFVSTGLKQLKENAEKIFLQEALSYQKLLTFGTPRRLILFVKGLDELQNPRVKSVQGPAKRIAYDENGEITKAGEGFARSQGVQPEELRVKTTERGEYVFAEKKEQGEKTSVVLEKILPKLIQSFFFPRTMHWDDGKLNFTRPIRWCLAIYGSEVVNFSLEKLSSGRKTFGHKLLKNECVEISNAEDYFFKIKKLYVIVDPEERKKIILKSIKKISRDFVCEPIIPDELLNEVVNLVEFPVVIAGSFDNEFMEIPKEVLIESMTSHQKYFPLQKKDGMLFNKFILVANNKKDKEIICEGNEKVLKARLADAKFFYHEDTKTPFINKTEKLKKVLFQEALGTLFEKTIRIESLSSIIAGKMNLCEMDKDVRQCAKLCKTDLVTEMVKEFPKLQGVMGSIYAYKSGESKEVSGGILEHYLPRFAGDILPDTNIGAIVSIADKMDTITGCFVAGLVPTGSEDPYALRRQAVGIIEIMLKKELNISLDTLAAESLNLFSLRENSIDLKKSIIEFLVQRLNFVLQEKGISYDSLEAVLSISVKIPIEIYRKADTIEKIRLHPDMIPLVLSFKRVSNIVKEDINTNEVQENLFKEEEEKKLYALYMSIEKGIKKNIESKDYSTVTSNLLKFSEPLENFFIKVLVMDKEPYRTNRIALLKNIQKLFLNFADFSRLVIQRQN
ncbi:glycine--tRNA ligase subunit beta [Candidatus Desantisbacteria bacterium]|nr:glycine--tRNA ligase subunit beta [Candidatus Desantisbacteria bacterium]